MNSCISLIGEELLDFCSTMISSNGVLCFLSLVPGSSHNTRSYQLDAHSELQSQWERRGILSAVAITTISSIFDTRPCLGISSKQAEDSYDIYASTYDKLDGGKVADSLGIEETRVKILSAAKGRCLEIGVGTGLNLSKYKFASSSTAMDGVNSLTLLDISDGMMAEARSKLETLNIPSYIEVKFIKADATTELSALYGDEGYFDTIVDTFSLCVMGNAGAKSCLEQMRNVVKKDTGRILLIENTRSSNAFLGAYQDLTADAAAKMGGKGCVSNQDVTSYIRNTKGLEILSNQEFAAGLFRSYICKRCLD